MQPSSKLFLLCTSFTLLTGFFTTSGWSAPPSAPKQPAPAKAVAYVNKQAIDASAVDSEVNGILQRLAAQGKAPTDAEKVTIRETALQGLIRLELLSQEGKKAGIAVSKAEVDSELNNFKKNFADDKAFAKALQEAGITEIELRKRIENGQGIKKFIESRFKGKAQASEQEAKEFYNGNKNLFQQPESVNARHILLSLKEGESKAEKDQKREKLAQMRKQLVAGADFAELAKKSSNCPSSAKGGELGFFGKGQMVKPFEDAAFALKPGEVSEIVETQFGFHLIKLIEKNPAKTLGFDETKAKIIGHLSQQKMNKAIELFLDEAKKKADIKIVGQASKK